MNRLIIIGNGFDLAHGLPTSYKDFIDDFWKTACDTKGLKTIKHKSNLVDIDCEFGGMYSTFDYEAIDDLNSYDELKKFVDRNKEKGSGNFLINFKNNFFKKICEKNSVQNWVDIENEYYRLLKVIAKHTSLNKEEKKKLSVVLNIEFEQVKNLLEDYLQKITNENYNYDKLKQIEILNHLNEEFLIHDFTFNREEKEHYLKKENKKINSTEILSFNYTQTVEDYANYLGKNYNYNYIHGKLKTNELPIIFGFGDEMDEDYILIENFDENEFLNNFKSIKYLENSPYKHLLNIIESEPFQVFIMGHSCGLSDRTLLSTIFENENCLSVKVFYHQYFDDKTGKIKDNYTEVIQNISRHFKDKKMLRKKVVEKRHCKPLIEIKLPKKE